MIPNAMTTTVVSNIDEEDTFEMGISEKYKAFVMASLTKLYRDPRLAVVREVYCNAVDSHREAGQTLPVRVSLPTRDNLMFVVEDQGVGMNRDDLKNVFGMYGESTKRESNNLIGAFGYGAKSPLALANQFTLTTVKDGLKLSVLIQRSPTGTNTISVVSRNETDEHNGVKVSVPIAEKELHAFNNTARNFFRFVEAHEVLVDGVRPTSIYATTTKLSDPEDQDFMGYVDMDSRFGQSYLIMGSVPYVFEDAEFEESMSRQDLQVSPEIMRMPKYFPVGMSELNLTPNREGVLFDEITIPVVDKLVASFVRSLTAEAQNEIDAEEDRYKIRETIDKWEKKFGIHMQWRGEDVPKKISFENSFATIDRYANGNSKHGMHYDFNPFRDAPQVVVTGHPTEKYKRISNYLGEWLGIKGYHRRYFTFVEELGDLDTPWVTENSNIEFADFHEIIETVKQRRKEIRAAERAAMPKEEREKVDRTTYGVIDLETGEVGLVPYKEIPANSAYLWQGDLHSGYTTDRIFALNTRSLEPLVEALKDRTECTHIVLIKRSRSVDVTKRRIPGLYDLRNDLKAVKAYAETLLTDAVRKYRVAESGYLSGPFFQIEDPKRIKDPEIRALCVHSDKAKEKSAEYDLLEKLLGAFAYIIDGVQLDRVDTYEDRKLFTRIDFREDYPLLRYMGSVSSKEAEHVLSYVNAVYKDLVKASRS